MSAPAARPDADLETAWAEWQRLRTEFNASYEDISDKDWLRLQTCAEFIVRTSAVSLAGVAVRLRLLREQIEMGKWVYQRPLLDSVLADLERLAKGDGA